MLLLTNSGGTAPDKIQLITSAAITVDTHASYVDASTANPPVVQGDTMGRQNTAITTAATTDICPAPASGEVRNVKTLHVRNKHASSSVDVTVVYNQNGTSFELHKTTLKAGEALEYVEGIGFFTMASGVGTLTNKSITSQALGATDTYITGSSLACGNPNVGLRYRCVFDIAKTGAGTATPILTLRLGTTGTTSDTARCTFTFPAGTAVVDVGRVVVSALFRTVGAGSAAVIQGQATLTHSLSTTGLISVPASTLQVTATGFDSTPSTNVIGLSWTGGTSAAHTIQQVTTEIKEF